MRALKLGLMSAGLGIAVITASVLPLGTHSSTASAAAVVVVDPPVFVPRDDFRYEGGYYRTGDGHYYHYDRERSGWHYGRTHEEGVRYEHDHPHR